jgi:hypothetical protein
MRCLLSAFITAFLFALPAAAANHPASAKPPREGWTKFQHQLRPQSPRWPDGRYFERYSYRGNAGDRLLVGLIGEPSGKPDPHAHLSLYIDRGDGVEPVRAGPDGFEVELVFDRPARYFFYVISRKPDQTGGYSLGFLAETEKELGAVYYHMISQSTLAPNEKFIHSVQVRDVSRLIFLRVDASGFRPALETFRHQGGSRIRVTTSSSEQGDTFATSNISSDTQGKWDVEVKNTSSRHGSFRLEIEVPSALRAP